MIPILFPIIYGDIDAEGFRASSDVQIPGIEKTTPGKRASLTIFVICDVMYSQKVNFQTIS
ncbi:hypothetical protein B2D07_06555 [Desulfococcus multivorans]|jgi:hypothetical protein|nr:hypothetical protein B2D07_06555 [Desulfococcus multivorans]